MTFLLTLKGTLCGVLKILDSVDFGVLYFKLSFCYTWYDALLFCTGKYWLFAVMFSLFSLLTEFGVGGNCLGLKVWLKKGSDFFYCFGYFDLFKLSSIAFSLFCNVLTLSSKILFFLFIDKNVYYCCSGFKLFTGKWCPNLYILFEVRNCS